MPPFNLTVLAFTPPSIPHPDLKDVPSSAIKANLNIPSILKATSSMRFTLLLPEARDKNALHPASHLQMTYFYQGTGEVFAESPIKHEDLAKLDENTFEGEIQPDAIPRAKVNHEQSSMAEVNLYAWKGEKLLGKWPIGRIEDLGIQGYKSEPIHLARVKAWEAAREAGCR